MQSNYKRLGDYIRQVDVRNRDLAVDNLLGLSISKQFIPSIANTIGTDMANYKVVQPRQFGYVPVTSRNGDKITVALYDGDKPCIISQAYIVFEVTDTDKLLPEYLMMWFRRPEFDRYARFKSHGSAREVFEWDEMCDVMLPVPPIEEQRKIVVEYQAVERRIENNRRLIASLESTAQTIYRQMFVDNIDPENLPQGWRMGKLYELIEIKYGKDHKLIPDGKIPIYGSGGIMRYGNSFLHNGESVLIPRKGSLGNVLYVDGKFWTVDTMFYSTPKLNQVIKYVFQFVKSLNLANLDTGSAVPSMTTEYLNNCDCVIPAEHDIIKYDNLVSQQFNYKSIIETEIAILAQAISLLLSKLSNL